MLSSVVCYVVDKGLNFVLVFGIHPFLVSQNKSLKRELNNLFYCCKEYWRNWWHRYGNQDLGCNKIIDKFTKRDKSSGLEWMKRELSELLSNKCIEPMDGFKEWSAYLPTPS